MDFLRTMNVPVDALHAQGYASIGCEPCTRPVLPGQHEREGRWWWEDVKAKEPRTICSGLVKYIPLHLLQDRNVFVLANPKPRKMRGVKSFGMLMAASDAAHVNVELLVPPEGAVLGERAWFGSLDEN